MYVCCSYYGSNKTITIVKNPYSTFEEVKNVLDYSIDLSNISWTQESSDYSGHIYTDTARLLSDYISVNSGTIVSVGGNKLCLSVLEYKDGVYKGATDWLTDFTVPNDVDQIRIIIRKNSNSNPEILETEIAEQIARCKVLLKIDKTAYFLPNVIEMISAASNDIKNITNIYSPIIELTDGIINENGKIIGTAPLSHHTSDIALAAGDTVIVNGFYYKGFAVVSKHVGSYYFPLITCAENGTNTFYYTSIEDMQVSIGIRSDADYSINIIKNHDTRISKLNKLLNSKTETVTWEIGAFDHNGIDYNSNIRIRSGIIDVTTGTIIEAIGPDMCLSVLTYNNAMLPMPETN